MQTPLRESVIAANVEVHSKMANTYNSNEPHFRPENQAKVRRKLERLRSVSGPRLLDLGCGTGFVINLARDLFDEIDGVDVTQAMLDLVDRSSGNITLHNCAVESLPFPDASFDAVSAYAFIHHVLDYKAVLAEAFRVLKPGGRMYIDLEPNRLFWQAMVDLERRPGHEVAAYSEIVKRDIDSVLHTDERVEGEFGISSDTFNTAEYTKSILGGIDPHEFASTCLTLGARACEVRYEWYLGQGAIMHGKSFQVAANVEDYLRQALPLSASFFKYLEFNVTR